MSHSNKFLLLIFNLRKTAFIVKSCWGRFQANQDTRGGNAQKWK